MRIVKKEQETIPDGTKETKRIWIRFKYLGTIMAMNKGDHSRAIVLTLDVLMLQPLSILRLDSSWTRTVCTVEAGELEHDRPPSRNHRNNDNQHKSCYIHVPTVWSLQKNGPETLKSEARAAIVLDTFGLQKTTATLRCQDTRHGYRLATLGHPSGRKQRLLVTCPLPEPSQQDEGFSL